VEEIEAKTDNLKQFGNHPTANNYRRSNSMIIDHLLRAASIQEHALHFAQENPLTNLPKVPVVDVIYAASKNKIIGANNTIPWKCSADMRHFKETTSGHAVVMGYNTYLSFNGRALPNRENYVIVKPSRVDDEERKNMIVQGFIPINETSLVSVLNDIEGIKIFVVGGTKTYNLFNRLHMQGLVRINSIIVTTIDVHVSGDAVEPTFSDTTLCHCEQKLLEKKVGEEDQPAAGVCVYKTKD
jgi:dihydrofolate reductase